ncbi:thioredoxin-like protein [Byssothecium circinans]|uniref:Thioredoxin-like protein n=1 Tax=Byssothecium circinans TaxID=147558 RepID=A0A6A5UFM6_9PLEO|nr:thioredoxin-like protein [Byssothecium circinans]
MSQPGKARIGHRAPDFHCDAVTKGVIEEVSLSTYIDPTSANPPWLIILFISATFSFVCPTEVLAFQNCLEEFKDRNCEVVFVSVDSKHALWHWQNVPRTYGGLGLMGKEGDDGSPCVSLLSDASHRMSRDYGVLIEEEGVCLRCMFILDGDGVVQQITINNLTVGRSVLEALRLLEAFQAVARHGVLCPIDWKPSVDAADSTNSISNTLRDSYEDRLKNLQHEFGDEVVVTDLDDKKANGSASSSSGSKSSTSGSGRGRAEQDQSQTRPQPQPQQQSPPSPSPSPSTAPAETSSSTSVSTVTQYTKLEPEPLPPNPSVKSPRYLSLQLSLVIKFNVFLAFHTLCLRAAEFERHACPDAAVGENRDKRNTYESRRGSHIILEFADPTSSPQGTPSPSPSPFSYPLHPRHSSPTSLSTTSSPGLSGVTERASALQGQGITSSGAGAGGGGQQTRLQATFEAIKKMSAGLGSPRILGTGTGTGTGLRHEGHALARKEPVSFVWGQREERKKRKNGRRA